MEKQTTFELKTLPKETIMAYKIFTENYKDYQNKDNNFDKQFNNNWKDAIYPQNCVKSALGYLPNYYDRGYQKACLYALKSKKQMKILICNL